MKDFKILDIATADMAFSAFGKTKAKMFENSAKALMSIMFEEKTKKKVTKKINVKADDEVALLHDFLSELLFLFDTEHIIFNGFKVKIKENILEAEVTGEKFDSKRHKFIIDVKAITYHKMSVEKTKDGFKCTVIVDV